jgi:hypothetical protein
LFVFFLIFFFFFSKYSALHALHGELSRLSGELPAFPGKTWTAPSEAVWKERCSALNGYFASVLRAAALARLPALRALFARSPDAESWTPPLETALEISSAVEQERFRFAEVEGGAVRLGYIERGDPKSALPLVLFVHGFPDTLWSWELPMQKLAEKGFFCVSMAQRGYFPSSIPAAKPDEGDWQRYGKHVLGRDILALVKALNRRGAVLVGHDFGAMAVWAAAIIDQREGSGLVAKVVGEAVPPPKAIAFKPGLIYKVKLRVSLFLFCFFAKTWCHRQGTWSITTPQCWTT